MLILCVILGAVNPAASVTNDQISLKINFPGHKIGADTVSGRLQILDAKKEQVKELEGIYPVELKVGNDTYRKNVKFSKGSAEVRAFIDQSALLKVHFQYKDKTLEASRHIRYFPGWTSVIPPLLAIILALIFREVITSLFIGILSGLLLMKGFSPSGLLNSLFRFVDTYLLEVLSSKSHLSIIVFSLLIGGMVSLISKNGGMVGLVNHLKKAARSAKRTQFVTWLIGILIFFDDYANTLIVGNTMRPLTDKFRISREKLAYLVDSTAAPIASIAFITTWIGAQLDYIQGATAGLDIGQNAYAVFFNSLAYAFYPVFSLAFILMLIFSNRDFGPMYKAEINARKGINHPDHLPEASDEAENTKGRSWDALIPLVTLILTAFGSLLYTGYRTSIWNDPGNGFFVKIAQTIGKADAYAALLWASLASLIIAFLLTVIRRTFTVEKTMDHIVEGFKSMLGALMILVLAWTLASVTDALDTSEFLANMFTGKVNPVFLPAVIFVLAGAVSFATGSSWGTMAILYPLVLPVTYKAGIASGLPVAEVMPLFYHVVSVVLAGSVMGDHCSPLSDTTILSSLATKCHHIQHVRTQLPYALLVGLVSLLIGHLLTATGYFPSFIAFPTGIIVLWLIIRYGPGKKVILSR